jgi:hypothetical protein
MESSQSNKNIRVYWLKQNLKMSIKNFAVVSILFVLCSCNSTGRSDNYLQGEPVILKKEHSLIPGICMFTYEGYGRKETFEDKCDKYSVGDKLGENMRDAEQDTLETETQ